jgi:4-amino-4-deoxy-L-arabinose transferase-like glycosyltransferase
MLDAMAGFQKTALLIFGFALALRLVALWAGEDATPVKDEIAYVARAEALLDGEGYLGSYQSWVRHPGWKLMDLPQYPGAYQPPGYPTFIAGVMAVSGRSVLAVKAAQCLLSAISCVLVLALGTRWFGGRAGRFAAWGCALYPNLIAYSHLLWSETLFIFELLLLLWLLFGTPGGRLVSPARAASAGAVFAAGCLTRGTLLYLGPVLVLWLWLLADGVSGASRRPLPPWRSAVGRGALMAVVALALVAPWSWRNYQVHGGFVLIDTNAPYNLWRGNAPGAMTARELAQVPRYSWPFESLPLHPVVSLDGRALIESFRLDERYAEPTDLAIADYANRSAWRAIRADPARALRNAGTKLVDMWNPTSFVLRHFELGAYGTVPEWVRVVVSLAVVLSYLAVCGLAVIGVARAPQDRRVWLILAVVAYFAAGSALAFGLTRFRLPLMPLFLLLSGLGVAGAGRQSDSRTEVP